MLDVSRRPGTFLLTSNTAPGHFLRVLDLAQQLSARGHRVLFKAKASKVAEVKAAGAELIPYDDVIDLRDFTSHLKYAELPEWLPKLSMFPMVRGFFQSRNVVLAQEIEPVLRRERVDCVVYDFFDFGAGWAAERAGIPWASAGNMGTVLTRDELPLMFNESPTIRPLTRFPALPHALFNQLISFDGSRAKLGLPAYRGRTADLVRAMTSPHLHIIMAHRGLAGDTPLRDNQVFVGPTAFNVSAGPREEAPRVEPGTVVVSTTTTGKDDGLFRRVLEAIAPLNVPVLGTAASAEEIPAGLGAHVRIERYIPHDTVFPEARALITHGGWGTVGRALTHGLPMLVIPLFGDQILNATLVERAGLGRHLPLKKATPEAIRDALRALLADDAVRARARHVADEIKQIRQDQVAARALEKLAFGDKAGAVSRDASLSAA
jgi:MGT family glycosyltransferase